MSEEKGNIKIEVLSSKLMSQGKTSIVLPVRESSGRTQNHIKHLDELVEKGLLSQEARDKEAKRLWGRTLDDETYDLFYECMAL